MRRVRFVAAARLEFLAEVIYYNKERAGLGARFTAAVEEATARAAAFPLTGSPASKSTRRVFVRDFPTRGRCVRRSALPTAANRSTREPPREGRRGADGLIGAVERHHVEVHIQIQRRAETLHQCDCAGRAGGTTEASLAD